MINLILKYFSYIFARPFFYYIGFVFKHLGLRMMGIGNYENTYLSGENYALSIIKNNLNSECICVDVGANVGNFSKLLRESFPDAQIYAFEPVPWNFNKLQNFFKKDKKFIAYNFAVGDSEKKISIWDKGRNGSEHASLLKDAVIKKGKYEKKYRVKMISLASFLKSINKKIDYLKIDVEGYEFFVLKGLKNHLNQIKYITFEFNSMNIHSHVTFKDFYKLLNNSFNIYRLYPNNIKIIDSYNESELEIFEFQNYIAINKKI